MSEVYEVGRKSFEDMTEMLLNNKNISNDQRRGLREAYVLSKREEYCLIGKSDDEVEEIIRKKSPKDRLSMMKCFKVPYSQHKRRLTVDELIKSFQKEMNDCFPSLRRSRAEVDERYCESSSAATLFPNGYKMRKVCPSKIHIVFFIAENQSLDIRYTNVLYANDQPNKQHGTKR